MSDQRSPVELRLGMEARKKVRRLERAEMEIERLTSESEILIAELNDQAARESHRLGVQVPQDAFLLDLLELVEVCDDGEWHWLGGTNNKGLSVARTRDGGRNGGERSVVRLFAEMFGVIDPDWEGILYPTTSTLDVNPWHREKRDLPQGKFRGNPGRYSWGKAS